MSTLDISGLTKSYGRVAVLQYVELVMKPGELVGLIGPNGSGKSTLMHCIVGIVEPDDGAIIIAGTPCSRSEAKREFGFVPDDLQLPDYLTGAEYVDLIRSLRPELDVGRLGKIAVALGIDGDLGKLVGRYSHGMKKKLQIAVAFASDPTLLILDEPFSGLDPQTHMMLDVMIQEYRERGRAVLVSTHDLVFAQRYFDRVYVLDRGRVVVSGSPLEICERDSLPSLTDVFVKATAKGRDPRVEAKDLMGEIYG